jgi:hypothetical protein
MADMAYVEVTCIRRGDTAEKTCLLSEVRLDNRPDVLCYTSYSILEFEPQTSSGNAHRLGRIVDLQVLHRILKILVLRLRTLLLTTSLRSIPIIITVRLILEIQLRNAAIISKRKRGRSHTKHALDRILLE